MNILLLLLQLLHCVFFEPDGLLGFYLSDQVMLKLTLLKLLVLPLLRLKVVNLVVQSRLLFLILVQLLLDFSLVDGLNK